MKEKQVQIPFDLYQQLVKYFLLGQQDDLNIYLKIEQGLKKKQEALFRHVEFSAKVISEKQKKAKDINLFSDEK